jgi:hypothetical protein
MSESFLHLEAREQSQIYRALAPQLARSPAVLEKDMWVCWVLKTLFTMPGRLLIIDRLRLLETAINHRTFS